MNKPQQRWPDPAQDIIVGLCVGELSATAVSQSTNLTNLLPLAVEAVRAAFRVGVLASIARSELDQRSLPSKSWSATVPRTCGLADEEILERTCDEIVCFCRSAQSWRCPD